MKYQDFSSDENLVSSEDTKLFLSFTREDITVVMATSVSANRKRPSHIGVYIINRILHARLWIQILTCHVQLVSKRMHVISSIYEIKLRFVYLKSQKY